MSKNSPELQLFERMKAVKIPFHAIIDKVSEMVEGRSLRLDRNQAVQTPTEGFSILRNFETKGARAANLMTNSVMSDVWPATPNRLTIEMPRGMAESTQNKNYYDFLNEEFRESLDDPYVRHDLALHDTIYELVKYGTAGFEPSEDDVYDVRYRSWGIASVYLLDDSYDVADTGILKVPMTVKQMYDDYGGRVSDEIMGLYKNQEYQELRDVLIVMEPRKSVRRSRYPQIGLIPNELKPYSVKHIEYDTGKVLMSGGSMDMPVKFARMFKVKGYPYGWSPAIKGLPDILSADSLLESIHLANEKNLDPAMGVIKTLIADSVVDTSPGARIPLHEHAATMNAIFPIIPRNIELRQPMEMLEVLMQSISEHFFLDRLLDFNTETEMTLGETQIRNTLRNKALASVYTRIYTEALIPAHHRHFNLMLRKGRFGILEDDGSGRPVIPTDVANRIRNGEKVYDLVYQTPATRIIKAEEANGIISTFEFTKAYAEQFPELADYIDGDESFKHFAKVQGYPSKARRSQEDVGAPGQGGIRGNRAEQIQEQQEIEKAKMGSEAIRNLGQSGLAQ